MGHLTKEEMVDEAKNEVRAAIKQHKAMEKQKEKDSERTEPPESTPDNSKDIEMKEQEIPEKCEQSAEKGDSAPTAQQKTDEQEMDEWLQEIASEPKIEKVLNDEEWMELG